MVKEDVLRLQVSAPKCTVMFTAGQHGEAETHRERQRDAYAYTPVNNVERVQISQRAGDLGDVELCPRLGKSALLLEVEEELERKRTTP